MGNGAASSLFPAFNNSTEICLRISGAPARVSVFASSLQSLLCREPGTASCVTMSNPLPPRSPAPHRHPEIPVPHTADRRPLACASHVRCGQTFISEAQPCHLPVGTHWQQRPSSTVCSLGRRALFAPRSWMTLKQCTGPTTWIGSFALRHLETRTGGRVNAD